MYDETMVAPMREELTVLGVSETRTAEDVEKALSQPGSTLAVINSVCGCAAANARPAVSLALKHGKTPQRSITVFAGNDVEAVAALREKLVGYPPSSPNIVLFVDGTPVFNLERHHIEGRSADAIAQDLVQAFDQFC